VLANQPLCVECEKAEDWNQGDGSCGCIKAVKVIG
jgi:hypothetical protein